MTRLRSIFRGGDASSRGKEPIYEKNARDGDCNDNGESRAHLKETLAKKRLHDPFIVERNCMLVKGFLITSIGAEHGIHFKSFIHFLHFL